MISRNLLQELVKWKKTSPRKPLILRGARQTGKTTLVQLFAREFTNTVTLNMEHSNDRRFWQGDLSVQQIVRDIELAKGVKIEASKTLLFIDEIQFEPKAIASLRYFCEELPDLHVIATGSLMELALRQTGFSFPVGRVSFLYLYPLRFDEFLATIAPANLVAEIRSITWKTPLSEALHTLMRDYFYDYLLVGGMPESVARYQASKSLLELTPVKEGLLTSFEEDVPKYARSTRVETLQFLIQKAPLFAGQRIQYANFADSSLRSREMKQAFEILEIAMLLQRIPGTYQNTLPLQPSLRASPKLLYLDVGLVTHRLSVDPKNLKSGDLNELFRGSIAEQVIGQELLAIHALRREVPSFWYRNQPGSTAEVDFVIPIHGKAIPIEVKSGQTGRLRSLLQFMEAAPHPYAVRIYLGPLRHDDLATPSGKRFRLLSIPHYLISELPRLLGMWVE